VLNTAHGVALRAVALGKVPEDAGVLRNLAIAGLVVPVDGGWVVTQTGHAVLEIEGQGVGEAGDLKSKVRDWFMT
jgi:hypothetical protein